MQKFLDDLDIVELDQDYKGVQHFFTEYISGFAAFILENSDSNKVAVKIPFETDKGEFSIETFSTVMSSIKNIFDSLKPKIDNELSL